MYIMLVRSEIVKLRKDKGYSCTKIHSIVRESHKISRSQVRSILIEEGLMPDNLTHGGYRPGSGKGTKYFVDGVILDSYAELCYYLKYKQTLGLIKNIESFDVGDHKYVPDFVDRNGVYYEVKSDKASDFWGWNSVKINGFEEPLVIVTKEDLVPIISEVEAEYSKDYLDSLIHVGSWRDTQVAEEFGLEHR